MFDWNDPNTYWLNVTDIILGLVTLASLAFVAQAVVREVYPRLVHLFLSRLRADSHAFVLPELGVTMADGGEPIHHKSSVAKDEKRKS